MQWKCQLMFNESTAEDIEVHSVNLCDFLVPLLPAKREKRYPNGTNYMFPERFNGRSSASLLSVELKLAGVKSGLSIVIRSSKSWKNTQRAHTITFKCDHGRSYGDGYTGNWKHSTCKTGSSLNSTKSTKQRSSYKTTSKRPVSAEGLCSFGFIVFLQDESADKLPGRWFLSTLSSTKCDTHDAHSHHFKLQPSLMHVPIQLMSDEERELAKNCSQLTIQTSSIAALLSLREKSGLNWKNQQITQAASQQRKLLLGGVTSDATSAERLIENFDNR